MKKILLLIVLVASSFVSFSQCVDEWWGAFYNFDSPSINYNCYFFRDTADTVNAWQIGVPQKTVLDTAYSGTRVIITDTINSYKPNDTSSFILMHRIGSATLDWHWHSISGYYFVNSDTLTDFGMIEFSPDNGHTWVDLMHDTSGLAHWGWSGDEKPVFSGDSYGWKHFYCQLNFAGSPYTFNWDDTVQYRFSFISDTADTHKDGLMFDNIDIFDAAEDVPMVNTGRHIISVYPNPATEKIHVQCPPNATARQVQVYDCTGRLQKEIKMFTGNEIDVNDLPNGLYVLRYMDAARNDAVLFNVQR